MVPLPGGGRARADADLPHRERRGVGVPVRLAGIQGPRQYGPRDVADGPHPLCRRRARIRVDRHQRIGVVRLFPTLYDGAPRRAGRAHRRGAGRHAPRAWPIARRARDRLPRHRQRPQACLALCAAASGREHGRMVPGGRARTADRRRRPGDAGAARQGDLPLRAQHEPRRVVPRAFAHQCRGGEPQPRMAHAHP